MNFIRYLSVILLQLFTVSATAQLTQTQLESLVRDYTKTLLKSGIDTICVYEEYCNGCYFFNEKQEHLCQEKILFLPTYILWKQKGNTYMTKKDICFDYSTQKISDGSFWQYYISNREKLKKEELKKPQYMEIVNGKKQVKTIDIENSIYFRISIFAGKDSMIKVINNFFFTKELGPKEEINLNYDHNHNSLLNHLHLLLQNIIKKEKEKKRLAETLR